MESCVIAGRKSKRSRRSDKCRLRLDDLVDLLCGWKIKPLRRREVAGAVLLCISAILKPWQRKLGSAKLQPRTPPNSPTIQAIAPHNAGGKSPVSCPSTD